jgi:anthranilate synthase component 1
MSKKTDLHEFLLAAKTSRVVPVIQEIFSDNQSPLAIFQALAENNQGSFLLESAEQGVWSRFSFVGVNVRGRLVQNHGEKFEWISNSDSSPTPADLELELPDNALDALEMIQSSWKSSPSVEDIPLTSGLVGTIGWDVIRDLENLPAGPEDDNPVPRISFSMIQDLVVIDHQSASLLFVSNVFIEGQSETQLQTMYEEAQQRLTSMQQQLLKPRAPYLAEIDLDLEPMVAPNQTREDFIDSVNRAKEHVKVGDVFQVVLSQRFTTEIEASALEVYRVLRALNPSPYMYLLNGQDKLGAYSVVGSSPESLVSVSGGRVTTHPIAGSRPRGKDWESDHALEASLIADRKETAEHLMLVDLARNDLLKVCEPASVTVTEFMQVHRFSHIMHLVSTVEGQLRGDKSPVDVFRATFPAGTLSGAPKPRALEIITDLEPTARGIYGGVAGYFDFAGNSDLAIAIRTAVIRGAVATVQAGAGIVLDSDPVSEYEETKSKARAPLRAIAAANSAERISN